MKPNYILRHANEHKMTSWSGGTTTEIFISPFDSLYTKRNFDFRISSATVLQEQSYFTKLDGYMRHIMVLDGKLKLIHESDSPININTNEQHYFDGSISTKSFFKCTDLNLMLGKGYVGGFDCIKSNDCRNFINLYTSFYSTCDNVCMKIFEHENIVLNLILNKGDFILFDFEHTQKETFTVLFENNNISPNNDNNIIVIEIFINKENLSG